MPSIMTDMMLIVVSISIMEQGRLGKWHSEFLNVGRIQTKYSLFGLSGHANNSAGLHKRIVGNYHSCTKRRVSTLKILELLLMQLC